MHSRVPTKKQHDEWLAGKVELDRYATRVLGERGWSLLQTYGRLMGGQYSGQYVSGLEMAATVELVRLLEQGHELDVHLMHRHRSDDFETSSLCLENGALLMRFKNREERA